MDCRARTSIRSVVGTSLDESEVETMSKPEQPLVYHVRTLEEAQAIQRVAETHAAQHGQKVSVNIKPTLPSSARKQ